MNGLNLTWQLGDRLIKPGPAAKGFLPRPWKLLVKVFYENLSQEPSISVASLTRDLIIFLILGKTDLETPGRINTFPVRLKSSIGMPRGHQKRVRSFFFIHGEVLRGALNAL